MNERWKEWESGGVGEWEYGCVTFEHRHENKSCSACRELELVNESVRVRVTFEHKHENKSCSACLERVNERGKH